jgi:DNA-binding MarR family transcriptional regulator
MNTIAENHHKYEPILDLISYWQEFEETEESQDFARFAVWLSRRIGDDKRVGIDLKQAREVLHNLKNEAVSSKISRKKTATQEAIELKEWKFAGEFEHKVHRGEEDVMNYHRYLPLDSQIAAQITRMNRFAQFYTKKAFQGLEISTSTEFGILAGINTLGNPRKTDLINFNLLEKTTGTELIKRMVKDGLVSETDDDEDKRSKRVALTKKGEALVQEAVTRLWEMSAIVTGNLTQEQKHEMAQMLNELGDFHKEIYFHQTDLSVQEILQRNVLKM